MLGGLAIELTGGFTLITTRIDMAPEPYKIGQRLHRLDDTQLLENFHLKFGAVLPGENWGVFGTVLPNPAAPYIR